MTSLLDEQAVSIQSNVNYEIDYLYIGKTLYNLRARNHLVMTSDCHQMAIIIVKENRLNYLIQNYDFDLRFDRTSNPYSLTYFWITLTKLYFCFSIPRCLNELRR